MTAPNKCLDTAVKPTCEHYDNYAQMAFAHSAEGLHMYILIDVLRLQSLFQLLDGAEICQPDLLGV